jgi:hypothetical protein
MSEKRRKATRRALEPAASQAVGTPRSGLVPTAGSSASPDASPNVSTATGAASACARQRFELVAGGRGEARLASEGLQPLCGGPGAEPLEASAAGIKHQQQRKDPDLPGPSPCSCSAESTPYTWRTRRSSINRS